MAVDFPTSPSNGQTFTSGTITYTYNSTAGLWNSAASGGGGSSVTVSDTAPTSPSDGDQWYNSLSLKMFVYYNDGSSSQWVPASPQQAGVAGTAGAAGAAGSATSYANLAAFPSSGNTAGDIGFATDTKSSYMWDGVEWQRMSIGSQIGPRYTTSPSAAHTLNNDGTTATTITAVAIDESGFPITYDWDAYSGATVYSASSLPAQLTSVTESNGVFSLVGSSVEANAGSFVFRTKASDGVLFTPAITTVTLEFIPFWTFSSNINSTTSLNVTTPLSITEYGSWTATVSEDQIFDVKMWGAAGAAAHGTLNHGVANISVAATATTNFGGGGGFASGRITLAAGQDYTIRVGQGGMRIATSAAEASNTYVTWLAGGMKTGYNASAYMASGGGYSGIFTGTSPAQSDTILLAGGGGGGGSVTYGRAGAGGGTTGGTTTGGSQGGYSGTQSAGGAPSVYNGAGTGGALYGGFSGAYSNAQTHPSGGGGYFGGGGGNAGAAGGGSGYASGSVTSAVLTAGSYNVPANSSDADRGSAGSNSGLSGTNGKILFTAV